MALNLPKDVWLRPPETPQDAQVRTRLIERAYENLATIDQLEADIAHWNSVHPEKPIDPDPDGTLAHARDYYTRMIAAGAD